MERVVLALVLVGVAVVVAVIFQRRKPAPPAGPNWNVPVQLDRADFDRLTTQHPGLRAEIESVAAGRRPDAVPPARDK